MTASPRQAHRGHAATSFRREFRRGTDLVLALTESDLRERYGRGTWVAVKWLIEPFAAIGVYLLLVAFVLDRGGPSTGLVIACAVVPFQLVVSTLTNAMSAVAVRRSVILNLGFPRALIPLASTAVETVAFGAALVILPVFMVAYGVPPTRGLLWLPLIVAETIIFAAAVAFPFSLFGVWFPDLRSFGVNAARTLFFISSGLVPLASIEGDAHVLIALNPLTGIFESYREVFLYGKAPEAWHVLYPLAVAVLLLALFVPLYAREQRQFAKVVD
jgi:ABC-type polysaccharide/polyol phosphate export permease